MLLKKIHLIRKEEVNHFKPVTKAIIKAAWQRNIKVYQLFPRRSFLYLVKGKRRKWFYRSRISGTDRLAVRIARNKELTRKLLQLLNIPSVLGKQVKTKIALLKATAELGYPLVVKPCGREGGKAVFTNIRSRKVLEKAFIITKKYGPRVIVEKYLKGKYYRALMINYKFFAAAEAEGAEVVGDGRHNIQELIKLENKKIERGINGRLRKIRSNLKAKRLLMTQDLKPESIPRKGQKVILSFSGADGGEWIDVTDKVHPKTKRLLIRIVKEMNLNLAGIDILTFDIARPIKSGQGAILEVNSAPHLDIHQHPTQGKPKDAAGVIVDMLFDL